MSVVKSFDDKSVYEDVLPNAVFFEAPQYVDTDIAASARKYLCGKNYPGVNNPELLKVFRHGDTHADLSTMAKARLSSIYGIQKHPEA